MPVDLEANDEQAPLFNATFIAEITAVTGSSPYVYSWKEMVPEPGGTGYEDANPGRTGDADDQPAYEINDVELAVGTLVQIRCRGVQNGELRFEIDTPSVGITAKEFDGSPSYDNITSLEFDTGFVLTQPAARRAKVSLSGLSVSEVAGSTTTLTGITELQFADTPGILALTQPGTGQALITFNAASVTDPGYVSITSQVFAGTKNFKDIVTFHDEIVVENGYSSGAPTLADPARITLEGAAISPGGSLVSTEVMTYREDYDVVVAGYYNWVAATRITSGSVLVQTLLTYNAETGVHTFDLHRGAYTGSTVSGSSATCAYALDTLVGSTVTRAGLEFTGGILTGGSFTGVTSVAGSGGTTGLSVSGGPITSAGTLTLGGTLVPANGGTGLTTTPADGSILTGTGSGYQQSSAVTHALRWGVD